MGVLWTSALCGGLGLAAYWVSRYGLRQGAGLPRTLAAVVLGWAWLTVGSQALGTLGLLQRGPLFAWVVLGLIVGLGFRLKRPGTREPFEQIRDWSWEEVATVGLVLWAAGTRAAISLLHGVKVVSDGPIYHLYFAARWWKSGRLEPVAAPFGESAATYFPATGDLWFSWLMVGWGGDRLAKVGQLPFAAVAGLAAVALARRLGAGRSASLIATAWFLTSSPFFIFTFEPNVDTIFVAGYLLAAYFFLRHALGDDGRPALALGALAAGCALGTKAPAIVFVPPLLALGAVSALGKERGWGGKAVGVLIVGLLPLTVAGYWYARNLLWTGNPLYPLHVEAFGRVWLAGWYGPDVMRLSQYYLPVSDWRSFCDTMFLVLDPRLTPIWLAAVAGVWAVKRKEGSDRRLDGFVWLASALAVANVALFWFGVPYRTQPRFMVQALGLAAMPLARVLDLSRALRFLGIALLAVHLLTPQEWPFPPGNPPWEFSEIIPNAIPGLVHLPSRSGFEEALRGGLASIFQQAISGNPTPLLVVGLPAVVGLASLATVQAWAGLTCRLGRPGSIRKWRWVWAGATTGVLLTATASPVFPWGADASQQFFPPFRDFYRGWMALDRASGPAGTRVAYAGTDIPYYLMGAGLRNEVRYVNVDGRHGWLMHDYHRAAVADGTGPATWTYPRPGWDRLHPDYDAWLAALRDEGIRLLVVTRANPANGPHIPADSANFPVERQWADGHPDDFVPLYGAADGDTLFRLYRVRPRPAHDERS